MKTNLVGSSKNKSGWFEQRQSRWFKQKPAAISTWIRNRSHRSPAFASVDRGLKIRNDELDLGLKCFNVNGEARSTIWSALTRILRSSGAARSAAVWEWRSLILRGRLAARGNCTVACDCRTATPLRRWFIAQVQYIGCELGVLPRCFMVKWEMATVGNLFTQFLKPLSHICSVYNISWRNAFSTKLGRGVCPTALSKFSDPVPHVAAHLIKVRSLFWVIRHPQRWSRFSLSWVW